MKSRNVESKQYKINKKSLKGREIVTFLKFRRSSRQEIQIELKYSITILLIII